jgi:protein-L-isoaspartate(D-aspartate) O-methyltransferase
MDFAQARANMIESQVRPNGITDPRIIQAMASVPREIFVPDDRRPLAYMDEDVPLYSGHGTSASRRLMEPMAFARLLQLLSIEPEETVLDVGCTTGYSTAVIARLARSVAGVEADEALASLAQANLKRLGVANAEVSVGAHATGGSAGGPYDAILLNGRIPGEPHGLIARLKPEGRLVAVVGERSVARASIFVRTETAFSRRSAFDATVAPLPGFAEGKAAFAF